MVKHVKLFENWAEENAKLPAWLDPDISLKSKMKTPYTKEVRNLIENPPDGILNLGYDDSLVNFKSFSDYDFWKDHYKMISINQTRCKQKLEDCFGIPSCEELVLWHTGIKSLKGLSIGRIFKRFVLGSKSNIENLKYCPTSSMFDFTPSPLLSYYGITTDNIKSIAFNLCGRFCYKLAGYYGNVIPTLEQLNDAEFNGNIFCYFDNKKIKDCGAPINPWINIYEDPNEVENYEFLFMPFYFSSENFRTKAKEYIQNLDITSLDRSDLW